jgi:class 3 adenylate cyclase
MKSVKVHRSAHPDGHQSFASGLENTVMDTRPFNILFSTLAEISGLHFEIWEGALPVYSTWPDGLQSDPSCDSGVLSALIIKKIAFQTIVSKHGHIMAGVPLRIDETIVGALIAHPETPFETSLFQGKYGSDPLRMEKFLTCLAGLMADRWNSQKESDMMVEELTQHMGDLYLYSRISTQVKSLAFSGLMLKSLIEELLETMRVDIAFSQFPDNPDFSTLASNELPSTRRISLPAFVKNLIGLIPVDAASLQEDYFIINDSRENDAHRQFHPDPFRFLVVAIRNDQMLFGWLGLVSFNMKEIFRQGELRLLKSLAKSTSVALENTQLYKESLLMAEKERSIRNIFQKYVPAEVVNEILDRGERDLTQLGEKRRVTLLNVDIRGYSRMSKKLKAEEIVTILNYFFMIMGGSIIKHRGMLDKYLGDGILAIFGAPVMTDNPALDATLAAIDMLKNLDIVNEFTKSRFGIPTNIGISIHTGEVILGNIGFDRKMEYTVIGDVVNDTFRLQELTREKLNSILISKSTQEDVKQSIRTRKLGLKPMRASESGMEVYEVTGTY